LGDYGSDLRDQTLILALLQEHKQQIKGAEDQLLALSRDLQARSRERYVWYSTQEQIALARLGRVLALDGQRTFKGEWTVAGQSSAIEPDRLLSRDFDHAQLAAGVRFTPESEGNVFATIEVAGVPRTAPEPADNEVAVRRTYYRPDGTAWKGGQLREGDLLLVAVTIESKEDMPDALLVDLLPAGLEIENLNLAEPEQWADITIEGVSLNDRGDYAEVQHEEFREDRYVAALDLNGGNDAKVFYLLRAVTPGTYVVPPPQVEDMYRPELRSVGRAIPASITVVPP
jgi:uncharacterized protein YfaS (alpha-2-macroglobulin family)